MKSIKVFYSPEYLYDGASRDTTRKAGPIAASLAANPIANVEVVRPSRAITESEIAQVHSPEYANAIVSGNDRQLADNNGLGDWTPEFAASRLWATGGVREAVLGALLTKCNTGSMSSGLHHARFNYGNGYCTINGLVIAAKLALQEGAKRVVILDLDAHGGGGTASLIDGVEGIEQVDVAVNGYDCYPSTANAKYTLASGHEYLEVVQRELATIANPTDIDVLIYNAGVDPHENCSTGGAGGITTETLKTRESMVFSWAAKHGVPVAFVFAGGYISASLNEAQLVELHRNTIAAAAHN